jgi:hypothetical protein
MNPDNFTHKTNEAASEADCSSYDEENIKQKHQVDNTVEEPDEYYKQQPDKIVEGKPDEYDKTLERPAVKRYYQCCIVETGKYVLLYFNFDCSVNLI